MITGQIDENREARVILRIQADAETTAEVNFLVDTGFNGHLAVTSDQVQQFNLPLGPVQRGMTADGRTGYFDTAEVRLNWQGQMRFLRAQVLDESLIGTRLLAGHRLTADWHPGGEFRLSEARQSTQE